ncbi:MAG: hypothetical protein VX899_23675 [Myxococcota bacterium]|nr:hypothetical protein [Myxococcota bacterium]
MRYLTDLLNTVLGVLGVQLPDWGGSVLLVVILIALGPFFYRNSRTKKARKLLQRVSMESGEERLAGEQEILHTVSGHPFGLVVVVEEAHKRGMGRLARRALEALDATGKQRSELKRLQRLLGPRPTSPTQEAIAIERLHQQGLTVQAEARLQDALARFPEHPELVALQGTLTDPAGPPESSG